MWNATPTASISGRAMMLAKFSGMPTMRIAISVQRVAITSGPRVIAIAARTAERVMFGLGASPERLQWGIDQAREARKEAGLDPAAIKYGSFISCGCHRDADAARDLVVGGLTVQTRFGVMHGKTSGPLSQSQEEVMQALRSSYNMKQHTKHDSDQAAVLTPEFIDEYAIIGMPDRIIERLQALKK